jgi:DNA-binding CsgD family transcriptional regulator
MPNDPGHRPCADGACEGDGENQGRWTLGIEARSRALLSEGQNTEFLYRGAIDHLHRTRMRVELGRPSALRRVAAPGEPPHRRARATAHRTRDVYVHRSRRIRRTSRRRVAATGERVRRRSTDTPAQLTNREAQIARLAGDGLSNPQIAAQLFMSPRTVEYHLHKVFTKLAISSRNQLHGALAGHGRE